MNQFLSRVPKPILVVVVLLLGIAIFIYNDPLKDECGIQAKVFERNTKGILTGIKKNGKIQYALLSAMQDHCKEGNSIGACAEYFEALRKIASELKIFKQTCQIKYSEQNENFVNQLSQALQIMSLVAWGEKPPVGTAERAGWLSEPQVRTFCALKKTYLLLAGEENYAAIRNRIYLEYPDAWPEQNTNEENDRRNPENRPKAFKTPMNPKGHFEKNKIFERSLFSIRCDLFL